MSRFRQTFGAVVATALLATTAMHGVAQETTAPDVALRGQMASITLDRSMLPGGYVFVGETFLTAEQVAQGDVSADDLTGAGFISQYVSVYRNPESGFQISSYVSAWTDAAAAEAGVAIIEDEGRLHPDGTFEDGDAGVGETPGETTTGSWPDANDSAVTVTSVDTTFRVGSFLVGTSLDTRDGSAPDADTVTSLAGSLEARATSAANGDSPDGTDLGLVSQALPLASLAPSVQVGFLGTADVESMYGLQGSSLGSLTASWNDVVALGADGTNAPFVSVGLTQFGSEAEAQTVLDQFADLSPASVALAPVDGFAVEGATAAAGFQFASQATGAESADSFRAVAVVGTTLIVIDVQGAADATVAQSAAESLIAAQVGCIGQTECAVPELPAELTGA